MSLDIVKLDAREHHGTALIASDNSVWVAIHLRWWDIATWVWWWLTPTDRKAWVTLTNKRNQRVRCHAIRVAKNHVKIRNVEAVR